MARKHVEEMVADVFREIAALVLVFPMLEIFIKDQVQLLVKVVWAIGSFVLGCFFLLAGLYMERRRPDE